jgi:hypothetical protein
MVSSDPSNRVLALPPEQAIATLVYVIDVEQARAGQPYDDAGRDDDADRGDGGDAGTGARRHRHVGSGH